MRKTAVLFVTLLLASLTATLPARTQNSGASDSPHVIEVTAKTFEFIPNEIHVKAGERVQINLSSADRAHGLKLDIYPEGASQDGNPGLVFDHPQDDAKVEKKKERVIEFFAARAGTYDFKCSVQCSMFGHGHDKMTGKLIVEEQVSTGEALISPPRMGGKDSMEHYFYCPYCGEEISMVLDFSVCRQTYVEDCEVCCNPIEVSYNVEDDALSSFSAKVLE